MSDNENELPEIIGERERKIVHQEQELKKLQL